VLDHLGQGAPPLAPIAIIAHNRALLVAPRRDVLDGAFVRNAQLAGHRRATIRPSIVKVKT
jgi:hypothetical protein